MNGQLDTYSMAMESFSQSVEGGNRTGTSSEDVYIVPSHEYRYTPQTNGSTLEQTE
jgi:hypothetical protein